jgi:hypothetical protein
MSKYVIQPVDIAKYTVPIDITADWVSSRDPNYPVNSVSRQENRYNLEGDSAYYIASGSATMQAEVPTYQERETYRVSASIVHVFDLASWSHDNGCRDVFLQSKANGGHGICQQISAQLTNVYGLSGILYNSEPMNAAGKTGSCLVILPPSGNLVGDTFFVRDCGYSP